jgi:ABC-type transporter Mla subunit MlaD
MIVFVSGNNPLERKAVYNATFSDAGLLQKGDQVRLNGIPIGKVDLIGLSGDGLVNIKFSIDAGIKLRKDAKIVVGDIGLFGTNYIKVSQHYTSKNPGIWDPGSTIPGAMEPGFDELLNEGHELVVQLKHTFESLNLIVSDEEIQKDLKGVFADLKASTEQTRIMFDSVDKKVNSTLDNVNSITMNLKSDVATSSTAVIEAIQKLNNILADIDALSSRNTENIDRAVKNITEMVEDFTADGKTVKDVKDLVANLREVSNTLSTFANDITADGNTATTIKSITKRAEEVTNDIAEMTSEVKGFVLDPATKEDIKQAFKDVNSLAENVDRVSKQFADTEFKFQAAVYYTGNDTEYSGDSNFRSDLWGQIETKKLIFRLGFENIKEFNGLNTVQVGMKFDSLTVRTGLIQDELGLGADIPIGMNDEFRLTLEGFNADEFTWRAAGSFKFNGGTRLAIWHQHNDLESITYSGVQQEF